MKTLKLKSPAKLNLFLHITGKRADGYHHLQSLFLLINAYDDMTFTLTNDNHIQIDVIGFDGLTASIQDNLIYKAAMALKAAIKTANQGADSAQSALKQHGGCHIVLHKKLPVGAGLGGGSSNAATTLLALNQLWQSHFDITTLADIGKTLGADVPFFVRGHSAWVTGIGENIEPVNAEGMQPLLTEHTHICLLTPAAHMNTGSLFQHPQLKRDCQPETLMSYKQTPQRFSNVFEPLVVAENNAVAEALSYLTKQKQQDSQHDFNQYIPPRMTGTGACVFAVLNHASAVNDLLAHAPCAGLAVTPLWQSPVHRLLYTKTP